MRASYYGVRSWASSIKPGRANPAGGPPDYSGDALRTAIRVCSTCPTAPQCTHASCAQNPCDWRPTKASPKPFASVIRDRDGNLCGVKTSRTTLVNRPATNPPDERRWTQNGSPAEFCLSRLALVSLPQYSLPFWWRSHHEPTGLQPLSLQRVTLDGPVSLLRSGLIPLREVTIWRHVDVQHSKSDNGSGRGRNSVR